MSKRSPRNKNRSAPRRFPWSWLAVVGALLLITGGLAVWALSRPRPALAPQVANSPRLAVDQALVDEGYVKFNVPVRTTFRLRNVGDQPLKIMGAPVELVEGC